MAPVEFVLLGLQAEKRGFHGGKGLLCPLLRRDGEGRAVISTLGNQALIKDFHKLSIRDSENYGKEAPIKQF